MPDNNEVALLLRKIELFSKRQEEFQKEIKELKEQTVHRNVNKYLSDDTVIEGEKVGIRKLRILRNQLCSNLKNNISLPKLKGMAKALNISDYEKKTKHELCAEIGAKLVIIEVTGHQNAIPLLFSD